MNIFYKSDRVTAFALALAMAGGVAVAQNVNPNNLTGSPYTRYGVGRLGTVGNASTRAMGDLGIAVRSSQYTNLYNPASLTSIDTLTMIFDMGLEGSYVTRTEDGKSEQSYDAGLSYMSFHFPLWGGWAAAVSFSPYSMVGYEYGFEYSQPIDNQLVTNDTLTYTNSYNGNGGLQKAMFSLGWRPYRSKTNQVSVGVDASYIWGYVSHGGSIAIKTGQGQSTYVTRNFSARGMDAQLGVQWSHLISANRDFTIGATFSPKTRLSVDADYTSQSGTDTVSYTINHKLKTPLEWGIGAAYTQNRRLTVGMEYKMSNWGDVEALGTDMQKVKDLYKNAQKAAVGVEYRPRLYAQSYWKTCLYRAGLNWKNQYIETYGSQNNEFTASVGIGMPVNKRSIFNLTIDYTHLQPSKSGLLKEDYLRLTIGMTFNEIMFFRSRLD